MEIRGKLRPLSRSHVSPRQLWQTEDYSLPGLQRLELCQGKTRCTNTDNYTSETFTGS